MASWSSPYTDWLHHSVSSPPVAGVCVCGGGGSGTLWLPSHHAGGCCTLVVDEKTPPPFYIKRFEYPEKCYINVTNYYYYKYLPFLFFPFFVTLKGFIIGKLVWLYCSDNLQNSKTNMTKNRDKIVNRDFSKKKNDIIFFPYRPPLAPDKVSRVCFPNCLIERASWHSVRLIAEAIIVSASFRCCCLQCYQNDLK